MTDVERGRPDNWVGSTEGRSRSARAATDSRAPALVVSPFAASATWISALAVLATVFGRWLPRGLPGSAAGIDRLIAWAAGAGAFVTQLFTLLGTAFVLRLVATTIGSARVAPAWRFGCPALASAAAIPILSATQDRLEPTVTLMLAALVIALALSAAPLLLAPEASRAAGIGLGLVALAALTQVTARLVADRAGLRAGPGVWAFAREASSLAFVLDLASLVVLAVWLGAPNPRRWGSLAAACGLGAIALAVAVAAARNPGASAWQVILLRSLDDTHGVPTPAVPLVARLAVELYAVVLAVLALASSARAKTTSALVCLTLISRAGADVPALALCLVLASLLGVSTAPTEDVPRPAPRET